MKKFTEDGTVNDRGIRAWRNAIAPRLPANKRHMLILDGIVVYTAVAGTHLKFRALLDDDTLVLYSSTIGKRKQVRVAFDHTTPVMQDFHVDLAGHIATYTTSQNGTLQLEQDWPTLPDICEMLDSLKEPVNSD